ncbi:MAG: hypothetical protein ACO1O1_03215 [Adhaeribacter sp.]
MKKIMLMLSFGLLVAGTASAQESPKTEKKGRFEHRQDHRGSRERKTPEQMASRHTEMLSKQLDLSNKQERKVQEITLKRAQQTEALRSRMMEAKGQDRSQRSLAHQEMKAINDRWEADLKDILSKKQYSQYEASREEMKSRRLAGKEDKHKHEGRKEGKRQPRENNSRENNSRENG